jgi:hypothetical protein
MNKKFNAVKFQRERRVALSDKLSKMSQKEIVKYFQHTPSIQTKRKPTRAANASNT